MTGFWAGVPTDRVVHLRGATPEAIDLALEPLPDAVPATVIYSPSTSSTVPGAVDALLAELERLVIRLFPAWLPAAHDETPRKGAFGPFVAAIVRQAQSGRGWRESRFAAEVQAASLVRLIAASYGRDRVAVLVHPPDDLSLWSADVLVAAGEWLAHHGDVGVWLIGTGWPDLKRIASMPIRPAAAVVQPEHARSLVETPRPIVACPAVRGMPRPDSRIERAFEAALARHPWARGRSWNETHQSDPLANPIRVDLIWRDERCVVELDGPEHRGLFQFEADRRRDVQLQIDGYAVLRFTNEQIIHELDIVLSHLEQFISARRDASERLAHA